MAHNRKTPIKDATYERQETSRIRGMHRRGEMLHGVAEYKSRDRHTVKSLNREAKSRALEARSKKAGYYVHGHKNFGDVYEA